MRQPFILLFLQKFSAFSGLIPIALALISYYKLDRPLKIILYFLAFSFILNMVNEYCATHGIHNLVIFHFYAIFEFGFILWYFSFYVEGLLKRCIIPLIVLFAVWCVLNFFYVQKGLQLNTYTRPVEAMMIMLYCFGYFNIDVQSGASIKWSSVSHNWITVGLLMFYTCSFFIFIFANYFLSNKALASPYFWGVYNLILIAENLLFAIGFYKIRKGLVITKV